MALAGVLSAMREIILDAPALPAEAAERCALYRTLFPRLSEEELEDLAAVLPANWQKYTRSIFAGERNLLTRYFQVTFALLERHWGEFSAEPFSSFDVVKSVHRTRPWREAASAGLAQCFLDYLTLDRPDIVALHPEIGEMARLEIGAVHLRHAADDIASPRDSLTPADLTNRTVGAVLELDFVIPRTVRVEEFTFDAPEIRREFHRRREKLPDVIAPAKTSAAVSRNSDGFTRWTNVTPGVGVFLSAAPRGVRRPLGIFAEGFVTSLEPGLSESEMFQRFMEVCAALISAGAVIILEPLDAGAEGGLNRA